MRFIDSIRGNREDLHDEISKDEEEKQSLETQVIALQERLQTVTEALIKKYEAQEEFDRSIQESEQAFMRILESSQSLLHVLKKEDSQLSKRKVNVSTRKSKVMNETQQSPEKSCLKPMGGSKKLTFQKENVME